MARQLILTPRVSPPTQATIHTIFHCIRWIAREEASLIVDNACARSGLVALICFVPVVSLMGFERLRKRYEWEIRKGAHFLAVPASFALCWHTNLLSVVMLCTLALYGLDNMYRAVYETHRVKTSVFTRLGNGTQLTFKNPPVRDAKRARRASATLPRTRSA